jgi:hypothetical protein
MGNMKIFIPTNTEVSAAVLASIEMQTLKGEIIISRNNYALSLHKRKRIAMAKEDCLRQAKEFNDFTILHDSDITELYADNFQLMYDFLLVNKNYGAVSLYRDDYPGQKKLNHICNSVMMVRPEALRVLSFSLFPAPLPTCISVAASLYKAGYKYGNVDKVVRIVHNRAGA